MGKGTSWVWQHTVLGQERFGQKETSALTLLMCFAWIFMVQVCASASSPCSGIFTKASCLCAVLVTLSMRETEVRNHPFCHFSLMVPGAKNPEWKFVSWLSLLPTQSSISSALLYFTLPSTLSSLSNVCAIIMSWCLENNFFNNSLTVNLEEFWKGVKDDVLTPSVFFLSVTFDLEL